MTEPKCAERVEEHFRNRMQEIEELWAVECGRIADEERVRRIGEEVGEWSEYGLSLDLHLPEDGPTDDNPDAPVEPAHLAFVISTGGPHEEFRFYFTPSDGRHKWTAYRVEFWLLDWWDGAPRPVTGENLRLLREIFDSWAECEVIESKLAEVWA